MVEWDHRIRRAQYSRSPLSSCSQEFPGAPHRTAPVKAATTPALRHCLLCTYRLGTGRQETGKGPCLTRFQSHGLVIGLAFAQVH